MFAAFTHLAFLPGPSIFTQSFFETSTFTEMEIFFQFWVGKFKGIKGKTVPTLRVKLNQTKE